MLKSFIWLFTARHLIAAVIKNPLLRGAVVAGVREHLRRRLRARLGKLAAQVLTAVERARSARAQRRAATR
jgi:hypothetical protein